MCKKIFLFILFYTSLLFCEKTKPSIAVLDFEGRNVKEWEAATLTDRFTYELMKTNKFDVMERNKMKVILEEQDFQKSDCIDQECAIEAGQLVAVQKIVTGTVAKLGEIYSLNVKMLDVRTGKIDQNIAEDCDCPIERVLTVTLRRLARKMAGMKVDSLKNSSIKIKRGDASLFIKTQPAGAGIYLDGTLIDGKTPITIENLVAGRKHTVQAKKGNLAASREVALISNQVVRISLSLKKQRTALRVTSSPSEAELYLDRKYGLNNKPDQLSPAIFFNINPGEHTISFFKLGYCDTSVVVKVKGNTRNLFHVKLTELLKDDDIIRQKHFIKKRTHRRIGRPIIYSSAGILAAGGILYYLAIKDHDVAIDTKTKIDNSMIRSGAEYEVLLLKNKDADTGYNLKSNIAYGLFGVGGIGLCVGLVLYF